MGLSHTLAEGGVQIRARRKLRVKRKTEVGTEEKWGRRDTESLSKGRGVRDDKDTLFLLVFSMFGYKGYEK